MKDFWASMIWKQRNSTWLKKKRKWRRWRQSKWRLWWVRMVTSVRSWMHAWLVTSACNVSLTKHFMNIRENQSSERISHVWICRRRRFWRRWMCRRFCAIGDTWSSSVGVGSIRIRIKIRIFRSSWVFWNATIDGSSASPIYTLLAQHKEDQISGDTCLRC